MIINTPEDLNEIAGTPEYDQFMASLRGSLFTVRKDEVTNKWVADEDSSTIQRFGLTRADFEPIDLPVLPLNDTPEELLQSKVAAATDSRNTALGGLVHTFTDGRVMQVRPKDEQNIRTAIDLMTRNSLTQYKWRMADNTTSMVTIADLQEGLDAGQDQGAIVWAQFFTDTA